MMVSNVHDSHTYCLELSGECLERVDDATSSVYDQELSRQKYKDRNEEQKTRAFQEAVTHKFEPHYGISIQIAVLQIQLWNNVR